MTSSRVLFVSVAVLAGALMGCPATPKVSDRDIQQVTYKQLDDMLNSKKVVTVVVDVRQPSRYAEGHIPGALNIPVQDLAPGDAALGQAKNMVVYAGSWRDSVSQAAWKKLTRMGYQNVFEFRGGLEDWKAAGRNVETSTPTAPAGGSR